MRLNKEAIQVIREEMIRSKINNCASGWFEYDGALYELVLVLRKELCSEEKGFIKEWAEDDVWDKEENLK